MLFRSLRRRRWPPVALVALVLVGALTWFQLARPLPAPRARLTVAAEQHVPGARPAVPWPPDGIAALGATEIGVVAASPAERPLPMYSVAKVMTALQVLADHPLRKGEPGPPVTITDADVQDFQRRKAAEESVVDVQAGEQLSELQLLQALLIPSGNNIADVLADWDAGSLPAFVEKLNARARAMGLKNTTYADAAGVEEGSRSTPSELTREAAIAVSDPVLADIASQPQVTLPVAGVRYNVDYSLGVGGITGIKTGSGNGNAVFMFASPHRIAGKELTVVGAVMGVPTLDEAFAAARRLVGFAKQAFTYGQALRPDEAVGELDAPWQSPVALRSLQGAFLVEWPGLRVQRRLRAAAVPVPAAPGTTAGAVEVVLGDQHVAVPVVTDASLQKPRTLWRLTRVT